MMRGPCPCAPALSRLPLFHDVMPRALKVIPEFIKRDLAKHCQNMQDDYREITSNPDWQRSDRETVWGEVHWGIADNNEARPLIEGTPNGKG
jgi:hypothetical protein